MDDMFSECKVKLSFFRIPELKEVLSRVGLGKTGRKQELVDRILDLFAAEEDVHGQIKNKLLRKDDVAKAIDETHRKMQHPGANDSGTGGHSVSDTNSMTHREEAVDQKIRCPCGSPVKTEFMIQCADPQCHVFQHIPCVIIPEDSTEGTPPAPSQHYCEVCRIDRCDPFWKTLASPLYPVKLPTSNLPDDGSQPEQNVEMNFQITRANVHLLENSGYDVQAWCVLLNDSVPFRMQWPLYPDLKINGIPVKTINRPGSKMLGANGRDDAPSIALFLVEGFNLISLSANDARSFCMGVRLVKQRTIQQVINMIPSEQEGESFTDAVARVCRCIGGGMAAANDDSDSDLEVIADNVTINLRCPMSGSRMKTAARFKGCVHLSCFDLHTFIQINQRSRKWQCPTCLKNYSLEDIIIDPYLNRVVNMMQSCDEDVTEIEVRSDGSWRAKIGRPFKDLERWHLPDGSLTTFEVKLDSGTQLPARESEPQSVLDVSRNHLEEYYTNSGQEVISMSSGSSGSKDNMMDFMPYTSGITNRTSFSSLGDPSVIILSDSEEENDDMVSPTVASVPSPPNGSLGLLAANIEAHVTQSGDAAFQAASSHPIGDIKAESSQRSKSEGLGDPFTFPRQPRTIRRPNPTRDVQGD